MTFGEIEIEALRLMKINDSEDITSEQLDKLKRDPKYSQFVVNMWAVINRCFADLENKSVIPEKFVELDIADAVADKYGCYLTWNLPNLAPNDYLKVSRVIMQDSQGRYDGEHPYRMKGQDFLSIYNPQSKTETYTLVYYPKITRVKPYTKYDENINLPDHIAEIIPYFICGEMFVNDDAAYAAECHNYYESEALSFATSRSKTQSGVEEIYSFGG